MVEDNGELPSDTIQTEIHETRTHEIPRATTNVQESYYQKKAFFRSYHIIWYIGGVIDALLGFRFVFELAGANPYNAFVQLIYAFSYPFATPFQTIFGRTTVSYSTFDWSLVVAMIVYLVIGYALVQLLRIIQPIPHEEIKHKIHTTS